MQNENKCLDNDTSRLVDLVYAIMWISYVLILLTLFIFILGLLVYARLTEVL